jgi:hypothetical protein
LFRQFHSYTCVDDSSALGLLSITRR